MVEKRLPGRSRASARIAARAAGGEIASGVPFVHIGDKTNTGTGAGEAAERRSGHSDRAIAAIATRQHGVVSRSQLRQLGLSDGAIAARLASGGLHPIFRGTFAVGHRAIGRRGELLAATLACGDGAVVSHGSAAELLGLWDRNPALVDVIAPTQWGRKVQGVRWHRASLERDEVTVCGGVSCTTASRTLVDLAGRLGEKSLRRLVERAAVLRLLDVRAVDRTLARRRRRGAPRLRAILAAWRAEDERLPRLRSTMEARLLAAIVEAGLPRPRCNAGLWIDGKRLEVDFLWEEQRLVVEADGEQTHGTRVAFRRDRWRDQHLAAAGYRTVRVTWGQLEDELEATLGRIRLMLSPTGR